MTNADATQQKGSRVSFPLPAKILACFFLNLAFFAVVAAFVAQGQFRFGLDSLLAGRSGERLQAMSEVVVSELAKSPRTEWNDILRRFADAYQVQIAAVLNDGTLLAGTIAKPPPAVLAKLNEGARDPVRPGPPEPRPPRERPDPAPDGEFREGAPRNGSRRDGPSTDPRLGFSPRPGPNGEPPPRREDDPEQRDEDRRFRDNGKPPFRDARPPIGAERPPVRDDRIPSGDPGPDAPPQLQNGGPNGFAKFLVHAGQPPMYWIGIRVPLPTDQGRRPRPASLLVVVPSLSAGGLLLDIRPWLWVGAGVLACSVLLWLPLVRGITRSIRQMTGAAGQMAQGQFGTRVDTDRRDELGRLGESLNHMAGRLGEYVTGQKRFLGDIAHELCSPLARMEMALGVLEHQATEKQQGYVTDVREEVRQMSSLVNELLSFSKAGLRAKDIELRAVPLAELCARVITREAPEANAECRMPNAECQPDAPSSSSVIRHSLIQWSVDAALKVLADPDLLARAIGNVLRNAVRYAGDAGPITITATPRGDSVLLTITDSGPGVPPETLHRLFDPFYRPETARTREGGGAGLGLAIVKSCVEACGGTVSVQNVQPHGLLVEFALKSAD